MNEQKRANIWFDPFDALEPSSAMGRAEGKDEK
jgi:hypothetical protein